MPRPRIFVNAKGKKTSVNTGVSLHQKSGRFYTLDKAGNRTYFGTFDEARACLTIADVRTHPPIAVEIPDDDIWSGPPPDELPPEGAPIEEIDNDQPSSLRISSMHTTGHAPSLAGGYRFTIPTRYPFYSPKTSIRSLFGKASSSSESCSNLQDSSGCPCLLFIPGNP